MRRLSRKIDRGICSFRLISKVDTTGYDALIYPSISYPQPLSMTKTSITPARSATPHRVTKTYKCIKEVGHSAQRITPYIVLVLATQAQQVWAPVRQIKIANPMDRPTPTAVPGGGGQQSSVDQHEGGPQEHLEVIRRRNDAAAF